MNTLLLAPAPSADAFPPPARVPERLHGAPYAHGAVRGARSARVQGIACGLAHRSPGADAAGGRLRRFGVGGPIAERRRPGPVLPGVAHVLTEVGPGLALIWHDVGDAALMSTVGLAQGNLAGRRDAMLPVRARAFRRSWPAERACMTVCTSAAAGMCSQAGHVRDLPLPLVSDKLLRAQRNVARVVTTSFQPACRQRWTR